MLPAKARLTDRDDFTTVVRRGRRSGRKLVVMHVLLPDTGGPSDSSVDLVHAETDAPAQVRDSQVGFVVSKAVGGSVVRHRVARRLRHLMRDRLVDAPVGSRIVVRALPASASADSASLGADLDRALRGALSDGSSDRRGPKSSAARRDRPDSEVPARHVSTPDQPAASSRP